MDKGKLSTGANFLRLSTLGFTFVFCTFAGLFLGWLLRRFLNWGDWVVVAGLVFGVITSYVVLFEDLRKLNQNPPKPPAP
jgi:F0F1-type ATP synthase assembly protein I